MTHSTPHFYVSLITLNLRYITSCFFLSVFCSFSESCRASTCILTMQLHAHKHILWLLCSFSLLGLAFVHLKSLLSHLGSSSASCLVIWVLSKISYPHLFSASLPGSFSELFVFTRFLLQNLLPSLGLCSELCFFNWVLLEIHSSCLASTENWLFIPIWRSSYTWSSLGGNPKHGVLHCWGNLCIALICSNLQGFLRLEDPNPVIIGSAFCCSTWRDLVFKCCY